MPEALKTKLENLSTFAKRYAEYRAKGLRQPDAAEKAGSKAKDRGALGRVGWNTEQMDGVKEYILWLEHKRAKASVIDNTEIAEKLRAVYEAAMDNGKYADANKAAELLGNMIGSFNKDLNRLKDNPQQQQKEGSTIKNNTEAFTQDLEETEADDRVKRLQKMIEDMKKNK